MTLGILPWLSTGRCLSNCLKISTRLLSQDAPVIRDLPLITERKLKFPPPSYVQPHQAWLETMAMLKDQKLGLIDLHPDVFGIVPRIDIIHACVVWQRLYRQIDYRFVPNRAELSGSNAKPWPQKGTGRARQGSVRSPHWVYGGKAFGPRGPRSFFYMLPQIHRALGLRSMLTCKYVQDNLHVVDTLDIPAPDSNYLECLIESRGWGLSVLFVDDCEVMPKNIASACANIPQYNLMPVSGLNVYSMLKHETLVLTLSALEKLEEQLLFQMHKVKVHEEKTTPVAPGENEKTLPLHKFY